MGTLIQSLYYQGSAKESFFSNSFLVRTKKDFGKRFFFENLFSEKRKKNLFLNSFFAQKNQNLLRKSFFAQKNKNLLRKSFFGKKEKILKIFSGEKNEFSQIFFENLHLKFFFSENQNMVKK